jgi:hypothetical protein
MPAKAKHAKRRIDEAAELEAWSMMFATGYDYFSAVARLRKPTGPIGRDDPSLSEARDAWRRLGPMFMASWKPEQNRPLPWAHVRFGPPDRPLRKARKAK